MILVLSSTCLDVLHPSTDIGILARGVICGTPRNSLPFPVAVRRQELWARVKTGFERVSASLDELLLSSFLPCVQHEPHQIDGRNVEVKAAIPKSRGGGQKSTNKLFVGGVPVRVLQQVYSGLHNNCHLSPHPLTTHTPLNEVADIARPESLDARKFNQMAARFAANPSDEVAYNDLKFKLARLIENHQLLEPFFDHSPQMKKIEGLSLRFSKACEVALVCLNKRQGNGLITDEKRVTYIATVEAAGKPEAGVELAIMEGLKTLVNL